VSTPDWFSELLTRDLTSLQIDQLYHHYELLIRWNQRMNLTTVKPGPDTVIRHYCESLFFAAHLPAEGETIRMIDAGSGAGFPGIPTAILKPSWKITLVESNRRKSVFLREASRSLPNVSVLTDRLEKATLQVDWVVARAVDPDEVIESIPRLAARLGLMIGEDEFSALRNNSRIAWSEPVRLPWGDRRVCAYGRST
jgi:16S rRNA (guanine527-N7)-methyltransferase